MITLLAALVLSYPSPATPDMPGPFALDPPPDRTPCLWMGEWKCPDWATPPSREP